MLEMKFRVAESTKSMEIPMDADEEGASRVEKGNGTHLAYPC